MKKLLPVILMLIGIGAGIGAGIALKPAHDPEQAGTCPEPAATPEMVVHEAPEPLEHDYVKLNNQFVVPVVQGGRIKSLVVVSLSLEITKGNTEAVYSREPKLRDGFLRVMFDHANAGGFDGEFTTNGNLAQLRAGLAQTAKDILGDIAGEVLITDIARQDG